MGTSMPSLANPSTMAGSAAAAASLLTVTLTSSDPAEARAATCWMVLFTSAVSVLVMDCTTTGADEPTRTLPILTVTDFLRSSSAINPSVLVYNPSDLNVSNELNRDVEGRTRPAGRPGLQVPDSSE